MATNAESDQSTSVYCTVCDGSNISVWSCIQCDIKMCDKCKIDHLISKKTCNHSVFTISTQVQNKGSHKPNPEVCSIHPAQKLSKFCTDCEILICIQCTCESHKTHSTVELSEIAKGKRKEFLNNITELKETLMNQSSLRQSLGKEEHDYVTEIEKEMIKIKSRGDELKLEIEKIANGFVDKLKAIEEDTLGPLRKSIKNIDLLIKDLKLMIGQREDDYKSMSDVLIVQAMGSGFKDSREYATRTQCNLKEPPKFITGSKNYDCFKTLFGDIDTESDHEKGSDCLDTDVSYCPNIDTTIISSFKIGRPASCISCLNDGKSWIGYRSNSKEIVLAAQDGFLIKTITFDCCPKDVAATPKAELLISDNEGKNIRRISRGGKILTVISTAPFAPQGVFATDNEVLVCLYKYGENGKVSRFNLTGTHIKSIQYDENKVPLFTNPCFVARNAHEDICVIDRNEILVVVDKDGQLLFRYGEQKNPKLKSYGITCDAYSNILLSDQASNSIDIINRRGEYLQRIDTNVCHPWGICIAKGGQLWICNSGGHILIVKYLS